MTMLELCHWVNESLAIPSLIVFLGSGIILTLKTQFVQIRAFPRLVAILRKGVQHHHQVKNEKTINPFQAVFAAMATTIGMGNIVGPSIAIMTGGPGALFWLIAYSFFGSATKFTEVLFAVNMRTRLQDGTIVGGPTQYLKAVSGSLARWYAALTLFMFAGWSGMQANTLASIFSMEAISPSVTGAALALITFIVLIGGIKRIGKLASKLVPLMFVLYIGFALSILLSDIPALWSAITLVFKSAFSYQAAAGGFMGATLISAMRIGIHRNMHITEAGLGSSSIAHSMTDADKAVDQAILAMFSIICDTTIAFLSGLLVLATGVWLKTASFSNTLMYEVFKNYSPGMGKWVLFISITLFVVTTVIGNSFNASQSYAFFFKERGLKWFYVLLCFVIFGGALMKVQLVWDMMDVIQVLVAIPHIVGLLVLAFRYSKILKV